MRFELMAFSFGGRRSNPLSYEADESSLPRTRRTCQAGEERSEIFFLYDAPSPRFARCSHLRRFGNLELHMPAVSAQERPKTQPQTAMMLGMIHA